MFEAKTVRLIKYSNVYFYKKEEISFINRIEYIQNFFINSQNPLNEFIIDKFNSEPLDIFDKFYNLDRLKYIKILEQIQFNDYSKYERLFEKVKNYIQTSSDLNSLLILQELTNDFKTFFNKNKIEFVQNLKQFIADETRFLDYLDEGRDIISSIDEINNTFSIDISYSELEEKIKEENIHNIFNKFDK